MKETQGDKHNYESQVSRLSELGINSLSKLQKVVSDPESCRFVARKAGVDSKMVLKWLNREDLCRIKNLSSEYLGLLEKANVLSVAKLASSNADELNSALIAIATDKGRQGSLPGLLKVINWVAQAKRLPVKKF